jgi:transposase-like protein
MASRQSYTKEQREAAVADVPALGVTEAAEKHGIPKSCVCQWAKAAGVRRETTPTPGSARRPKATRKPKAKTTHRPKADAQPKPKAKGATKAPKHEKPSAASEPAATEPPVRRTLKSRVAKVYTPSQKALILEDAAKEGVTAASQKHGVSRFTIYDWDRKVAKAAKGEGPSPTTGPAPKDLEAQRDKEILDEWHRHPGLGPSQIRNQLARKSIKVSVNTARRVMEEAGYRPPKVEKKAHDQGGCDPDQATILTSLRCFAA